MGRTADGNKKLIDIKVSNMLFSAKDEPVLRTDVHPIQDGDMLEFKYPDFNCKSYTELCCSTEHTILLVTAACDSNIRQQLRHIVPYAYCVS